MLFKVYKEQELQEVAAYVAGLSQNDSIIFLYGDLGSGKTSFAKYLMREFGATCCVTSPTFNIMNIYTTASFDVYHFDFYRIEDSKELINIGLEDATNTGLVIVEWPQIIKDTIHATIIVEINVLNEGVREVNVRCN